MNSDSTAPVTVRALSPADLAQVVAIDSTLEGRSRRAYVERRLAAALRDPPLHAQFAAVDTDGLAGYLLARVLEGEFGSDTRSLRVELVGVRSDARGHHVGRQLMDALSHWAARRAIRDLRTQAVWNDSSMLGWLDAMGFRLAPEIILSLDVGGDYALEREDAIELAPVDGPGPEISFSGDSGNDFERLARDRADVHSMTPSDLADIVRIDKNISAVDHSAYLQAKLAEAMMDSSVRISLVARRDGVNVGYLMARADLGDFGRTEPVAIVDTLGVDPEYAHHGVGRALMSQLLVNLGALRIERLETVVATRNLALLGFMQALGFGPSQRLPFICRLNPAQ